MGWRFHMSIYYCRALNIPRTLLLLFLLLYSLHRKNLASFALVENLFDCLLMVVLTFPLVFRSFLNIFYAAIHSMPCTSSSFLLGALLFFFEKKHFFLGSHWYSKMAKACVCQWCNCLEKDVNIIKLLSPEWSETLCTWYRSLRMQQNISVYWDKRDI